MAARKEPALPTRPLIGINTEYLASKNATPYLRLNAGYIDAILAGGGLPVILPPLRKDNLAEVELTLKDQPSATTHIELLLCQLEQIPSDSSEYDAAFYHQAKTLAQTIKGVR